MQTTVTVLGGMFDSTSVVETVDGFPRGDKAVDASFFAQMMKCFYSDGVIRPGDGFLEVTPGEGLALRVQAGCGWILGHMAWVQEAVSAAVEAGHSYGVTLRLHRTDGRFTLEFREDPAEDTVRGENTWDLLLAKVSIPGGAAAVTADMITDCRLDPELCGAVNSSVDALQTVDYAANSGAVGGVRAADLLAKTGGTMTGVLRAYNDTTGTSAVRNIRYGYQMPETTAEGEVFILLSDNA